MQRLDISLLGGFRVSVDDRPLDEGAWPQRRAADIVKLLALAPRHRMTRDEAIDALWPHLGADAGLANLHKAAHLARRALGDRNAIVLRGGQISLAPDADVRTDVQRFEATGDVGLYSGDLLPEDRYEEWAARHRERLREAYLAALRAGGRWRELAIASPTDEEAARALMRAHAERGQRAEALRQFARLRDALSAAGLQASAETVALKDELSRGPAAVAPIPPRGPLVGREAELETARAAWRRAGAGSGGALIVSGEAGIGKTRLCEALLAEAAAAGWATLRGGARAEEGAVPYAPVSETLDRLLLERPDLIAALPDRAAAELARLSVLVPGEPPAEPPDRKRIFSAVAQLAAATARERGAVLLIEDVHAADEATLQLVHYLVRAARFQSLLVVLSHRPAPDRPAIAALRAGLLEQGVAEELALGPLGDAAAAQLVALRAPEPPAPDAVEAIRRLAGGNPFFLEELAAAVGSGGTIGVPARLYEILHARLARLDPTLRGSLERLAVAGTVFSGDDLAALTELDGEAALAALDRALALGIVVERGSEWAFRHAIVREALVRGLPAHRRAAAHRDAAARLARVGAPPARVARHLLDGGRPRDAVPWLLRAAAEAAGVAAYADALAFIRLALPHASEAERRELLPLRADLLLATGDPGAVMAYGQALAVTPSAQARTELRVRQSRAHLAAGDVAAAADALDGLDAEDPGTRTRLLIMRGMVGWYRGEMEAAGQAVDEARRLGVDLGLAKETTWAAQLQAMVAHSTGRWPGRVRMDMAETLGSPEVADHVFDAHFCVAEYVLTSGEPYDELAAFAGDLREAARRSGARRVEAFATTVLGEAELLAGWLEDAEAHLAEAVELNRRLGGDAGEALARLRRAEALHALGRRIDAAPEFEQALLLAQRSSLAGHVLYLVYASILRAADDAPTALSRLDEAEALLEVPECAPCPTGFHVQGAIAAAGAGSVQRAREHLARAERHAALWRAGPWPAALGEARAAVALAEGGSEQAAELLREAVAGYAACGQPINSARAAERLAALG